MYRASFFILVVVGALAVFIWASDRITIEGERTIYTVACVQGVWDGLRCTGHLEASDRHRFRSSRSRQEVVYWIAGSSKPSGKYTGCEVTDRDRWVCKAQAGEQPSIAHELFDGRPVSRGAGVDLPFHAVNKWKWWAMHYGIPGFSKADFNSSFNPHAPGTAPPDAARQ